MTPCKVSLYSYTHDHRYPCLLTFLLHIFLRSGMHASYCHDVNVELSSAPVSYLLFYFLISRSLPHPWHVSTHIVTVIRKAPL
ncbi:hypothetical protein PISMIDRAFT_269563 [Pisolithus microcarpus 441]|uniref:Unplaced genomic scaffold scaffold_178, whole genome shotgun sequence n=1 Tax=Pisolithus microcarpus 441 TaxID=765257 RepID=A0A0C9YR16_9AGAM|nr:hypothetical protein BKA83DRAFT_269563 [Pisolithus microcarpus]KIK16289.1 hypothetical protein PISMIDRAFT_269563 [Pisolithus microcarpus 441]